MDPTIQERVQNVVTDPSKSFLSPEQTSELARIKTSNLASLPSVVTSDIARKKVDADINELGAFTQRRDEAFAQNRNQLPAPAPAPVADTATDIALPTIDNEFIRAAESGLTATTNKLSALESRIDQSNRDNIQAIKDQYFNLIEDQRDYNKSFEAGTFTGGLRSGRERYAQQIQLGIYKDSVDQGIEKVERLVAKKEAEIRKAQSAMDEGSYERLSSAMDSYREIIKQEREAAQKTFDNSIKLASEIRANTKAARDKVNDEITNQNIIRDDARASIKTIVDNFGGIDVQDLTEGTLIDLVNIANTAGIPFENLLGKTVQEARLELSEKTFEATERQRSISNALAATNIDIKRENQALARQKQEAGATLSAQDVQRLELPRLLIGASENDIYNSLKTSEVPWWFRDSKRDSNPQQENETVSEYETRLQPEWEKVRQSTIESSSSTFGGGFGYGAPIAQPIDLTE